MTSHPLCEFEEEPRDANGERDVGPVRGHGSALAEAANGEWRGEEGEWRIGRQAIGG